MVDLLNTTFVTESTMSGTDSAGGDAVLSSDSNPEFLTASLIFLKRLLRCCENKRYFLAFEVCVSVLARIGMMVTIDLAGLGASIQREEHDRGRPGA